MRVKRVMRWSPQEQMLRVCRFIWRRGKGPGVGGENYDAEFTVALRLWPRIGFRRELHGWRLWFLFLRLHHERSYGGVIV